MLTEKMKQVWEKLWILLRAFGLLIICYLPAILLSSFKSLGLIEFQQLVFLAIGVLIALTTWFFWWRAEKNGLQIWDSQLFSWRGLGIVLLGYIVMFCCDSLALYLMNVQGVDTTANQKEIVQLFAGLPFWLAFLLTTPLPALAEEVVFRGYLYKKLFGKYRLVGLLLTSFLFGLLHGPTDWLSWFIYSSSGFVLGYVYYRTDYLVYPFAIHLMNNGIATIVHYFFTK